MKLSHCLRIAASVAVACSLSCDDTPTSCFPAGVQISTPRGTTAIENVHKGDSILSIDPISGDASISIVESVTAAVAAEWLQVKTASGVNLRVTQHHPFWTPSSRQFIPIGDLRSGDLLGRWRGDGIRRDSILSVGTTKEPTTVYHLVVDRPPHTFLADGYIVHNKTYPPTCVFMGLHVTPEEAGWILVDQHRVAGRGDDTLQCATENEGLTLEAVPRIGWNFDHWEGTLARTDTFVVWMDTMEGGWARCVFVAEH